MGGAVLAVNGTRIWHDDRGPRDGETLLMIPGAGARADLFGEGWCDPIFAAGYRVLRMDNRDIGRSEWIDFERNPYTLDTMAGDVIALLDELRLSAVHLVGNSMGGMIAQLVAIRAPRRVLSLSCQASGPVLPMPGPEILALASRTPGDDAEARVAHGLALARALHGGWPFDEAAERAAILRDMDSPDNPGHHHSHVALAAPDRTADLMGLIVPTLWVHGTDDPLFPFARTRALAEAMPDAVLLALDGVGHRLPAELVPRVAAAVTDHLRRHGPRP